MEPATATFTELTSDLEILRKMEDDNLRLQRQVRMIQTDRQNRTMGVHPQFRRQDHLLGRLKKEYLNLKKDLKIARSGAHKKKDKKMKIDLKNGLLFRTKTEMECDAGVTLMNQLDALVKLKNKKLLELRKTVNANYGQLEERRIQSERRLLSTENRLEAAMLRFNSIQGENMKIREQIQHMLKDRESFNIVWSKMLAALTTGKKFLTDLFESSSVAYDQRDEWCRKLRSLTDKGKIDQLTQVQEMRDLQKVLDHDMKIHDFLAKKGVMRVNKYQEEKERLQKEKKEEHVLKELDRHTAILQEIYDYKEVDDFLKIEHDFRLTEGSNFSLYQRLTETMAERQVLSRELETIRRDLVDRQDWNDQKEAERQNKLQKLKEELGKQQTRTEELVKQREIQEQLINTTMEKIAELFKMLDCSLEPFENLLGDKEPSRWQLNLTLTSITEKIQEYLETVYFYERFIQKKDKSTTSRLKKYTVHAEPPDHWTATPLLLYVPADPCPNCIEARWLSRLEDEPEVPFNKDMTLQAIEELSSDPAYLKTDRLHALCDCRLPRSRLILARRYL